MKNLISNILYCAASKEVFKGVGSGYAVNSKTFGALEGADLEVCVRTEDAVGCCFKAVDIEGGLEYPNQVTAVALPYVAGCCARLRTPDAVSDKVCTELAV